MVAYKDTIIVEQEVPPVGEEKTHIWYDGWRWDNEVCIDDIFHGRIPNSDLHLIVSRGLNRW